LFGPRTAEALA